MSLLPNENCHFSAVSSEKRSKCDFTCCNGPRHQTSRRLDKLPDTFAVLDLDSEIARFASGLDYLMASTPNAFEPVPPIFRLRQLKYLHRNSVLVSDFRIYYHRTTQPFAKSPTFELEAFSLTAATFISAYGTNIARFCKLG